MLWPAPSGFSRAEVIANLRHFKPVTPFGSNYAYSNALYVAAGELIASVSGTPFETFVQTRLMDSLGIPCFAGEVPDGAMTDAAEPYVPYQGKPLRVDRNRLIGRPPMMTAAGGITCNACRSTIAPTSRSRALRRDTDTSAAAILSRTTCAAAVPQASPIARQDAITRSGPNTSLSTLTARPKPSRFVTGRATMMRYGMGVRAVPTDIGVTEVVCEDANDVGPIVGVQKA